MDAKDLRIALFSGNYNYTRDGCNQALNRLAEYLLRQGAKLRVYAPVVEEPDFPPTGDLVDVPNMRMPVKNRGEYRLGLPVRHANLVVPERQHGQHHHHLREHPHAWTDEYNRVSQLDGS